MRILCVILCMASMTLAGPALANPNLNSGSSSKSESGASKPLQKPEGKPETKASARGKHNPIQTLKTPNGHPVWFVKNNHVPVFTIKITFRNAGSKATPKTKAALVDILGAMLTEGARGMTPEQFKRFLIDENIDLAAGGNDDSFSLSVRGSASKASEILMLLGDILTTPTLDLDKLSEVKKLAKAGIAQSRQSPKALLMENVSQSLFKSHSYGRTMDDMEKSIDNITACDLMDHVKHYLTQHNVMISVNGQMDAKTLLPKIDAFLNRLTKIANVQKFESIDPNIQDKNITYLHMDIPQSVIVFYHPGIHRHHDDFYAFTFATSILCSGSFESRFFQDIREKKGLAYYIGGGLNQKDHIAYILGSTGCETKNVAAVIDEMKSQWTKMVDHGVTEDELKLEKQNTIEGFPLRFTQSTQFVGIMDAYQYHGIPADYYMDRESILSAITTHDIKRVVQKHFNPDFLRFFVIGRHNPDGTITKSAAPQ